MPAHRTPNHLKEIRGTDQPCRMADGEIQFDPIAAAPECPQWIEIEGRQYWENVVPALMAKRVLTDGDVGALTIMCALYGRVHKAYKAGVDLPGSTITQLRLYQDSFGLTPVSRTKVRAGEKAAGGNKFGSNIRKPGA